MILVGIGAATHDSSICVSIHGKVKYAKKERETGIKHEYASPFWYVDILKRWGIELDDIDALAFTDDGIEYLDGENDEVSATIKSPCHGETVLGHKRIPRGWKGFTPKNKNIFLLDHHYAHFWSNTETNPNDFGIILDGLGSGNYSCYTLNHPILPDLRQSYLGYGEPLSTLGEMCGLSSDVPRYLRGTDLPGKIMGMYAYGKPDPFYVNALQSLLPHHVELFIECIENYKTDPNPNNQEFLNLVSTVFDALYIGVKKNFEPFEKLKSPITYMGGVALNVNWNRWLLDDGYILNMEPHVYDGGLSVGCLRFLAEKFDEELDFDDFPYIQNDECPDSKPSDETITKVAELLADGKIVGWYQGHGEIGPRALGNRSILMNPSVKNGKDIINSKVKHREWWRPFGASVKQDKAHEYFDLQESPYMLYSAKVLKSGLDAITHEDGSCRHQTVTPEQNEVYYKLLDAFEEKTGLPVLLNTSLNLGGKPIAGTMAEANELFQTTEMDALCLGNHLLLK